MPDETKPPEEGAEVTPIEEARRKRDEAEAAQGEETPEEKPEKSVQIGLNELLAPVMVSIAQEVSKFADADGVVRMTEDDEANRKKTAAILKGLGQGLGAAISQAFEKWAANVETEEKVATVESLPTAKAEEPAPDPAPSGTPPAETPPPESPKPSS